MLLGGQKPTMSNLKDVLKNHLIENMIAKSRAPGEYVVLVVDPHTTKILSSCARMYDIMDTGKLN